MQGRVPALTVRARVFGQSTPVLLASFDPGTSSWRTSQLSLLGGSEVFSGTWPRSGMTRSGIAFRLQPLAPLTKGIVSGLLPTPAASPPGWKNIEVVDRDGNPPNYERDAKKGKLAGVVMMREKWPTPTARLGENRGAQAKRFHNPERSNDLDDAVAASGSLGQLNPTWVEWLMGFPTGWTALEDWGTRSSRKSRNGSG